MSVCLDFFDRVKDLVKEHNTTVRTVIEGCGINYDSYNSCKRYGNLPRADEAVRIAKALQTSVEYLVTGEDTNPLAQENAMLKEKLANIARIAQG